MADGINDVGSVIISRGGQAIKGGGVGSGTGDLILQVGEIGDR